MDYRGRRVTIMGLGHFGGGVAAARWFAQQGAIVTVTDLADENALADSLPLLADVPIAAVHLGGHREEDFRKRRSRGGQSGGPARPARGCKLPAAAVRDCRTEIELFIENCPAQIIGVTGSNGKSTTAAMIASILRARSQEGDRSMFSANRCPEEHVLSPKNGPVPSRRTFLGGNIGGSLLDQLPQIGPNDWVVLEISSFQLWHASPTAPGCRTWPW